MPDFDDDYPLEPAPEVSAPPPVAYADRPYLEAITPEHREVLKAAGQLPKA